MNENFNWEGYACNGYHNLFMIAFSLHNIAVLIRRFIDVFWWVLVKCCCFSNAVYQCILMGISKNEGLKRLNNASDLGKTGIL